MPAVSAKMAAFQVSTGCTQPSRAQQRRMEPHRLLMTSNTIEEIVNHLHHSRQNNRALLQTGVRAAASHDRSAEGSVCAGDMCTNRISTPKQ
eukprot:355237-Chlamydomonas_euryale.AAC.11